MRLFISLFCRLMFPFFYILFLSCLPSRQGADGLLQISFFLIFTTHFRRPKPCPTVHVHPGYMPWRQTAYLSFQSVRLHLAHEGRVLTCLFLHVLTETLNFFDCARVQTLSMNRFPLSQASLTLLTLLFSFTACVTRWWRCSHAVNIKWTYTFFFSVPNVTLSPCCDDVPWRSFYFFEWRLYFSFNGGLDLAKEGLMFLRWEADLPPRRKRRLTL